ncbi:MAG: hypothetical protein IPM79_36160 [Polyangiaceae bacterium]|nr:hypothetical protein [Polyangiaceae bacterium]
MTAPEDHLRRWLSGRQTGCYFAARLAAKGRGASTIVIESADDRAGPEVEGAIDGAAAIMKPLLVLFPRMRTPADVAQHLVLLASRPRWSLRRLAWRKIDRPGDVPLSLLFKTHDGLTFAALGLAPLGSMPVTRRAPYVAMAFWGGGHENLHRPGAGVEVGLPDIPTGLSAKQHDELWDKTTALTKALLADPPEDRFLLRNVTFVLPRDVVATEIGAILGP